MDRGEVLRLEAESQVTRLWQVSVDTLLRVLPVFLSSSYDPRCVLVVKRRAFVKLSTSLWQSITISLRKLIARGLVGGRGREAPLPKGLRCACAVAPPARRCHRGLPGALEVLLVYSRFINIACGNFF